MFATPFQVRDITGFTVTSEQVKIAQNIVEAFVGKQEADIDLPNDRMILMQATAYQTAYMLSNAESVFEQMPLQGLTQGEYSVRFFEDHPVAIAPLARMALNNLSWKRSRSVYTGRLNARGFRYPRWEEI